MNSGTKWAGTALVVLLAAAILELVPTVPVIPSLGSDPHAVWLLDWAKTAVPQQVAIAGVAVLLLAVAYVLHSHSHSPRLLRRDAWGLVILGLVYCATPGLIIAGQIATDSRPRGPHSAQDVITTGGLIWVLPGVAVRCWASAIEMRKKYLAKKSLERTQNSLSHPSVGQ